MTLRIINEMLACLSIKSYANLQLVVVVIKAFQATIWEAPLVKSLLRERLFHLFSVF